MIPLKEDSMLSFKISSLQAFYCNLALVPGLTSFDVPASSWDKSKRSQIYMSQREREGSEVKVDGEGGSGAHERHSDDALFVVLGLVSLEL